MTSRLVTSRHVTSGHVTSRHITSRHVTSHTITYHHIPSHDVTWYHIMICPPPGHDGTIFQAAGCHVSRATSHHITYHHIISHCIISRYVLLLATTERLFKQRAATRRAPATLQSNFFVDCILPSPSWLRAGLSPLILEGARREDASFSS